MFFDIDDDLMRLEYDLKANNPELVSKMKGAVTVMGAMVGMKMKQSVLRKHMLDAVQINRQGDHLLLTWGGNTADFEKMTQAMRGKKSGKMECKQYRKKPGKDEDIDKVVPKEGSRESLDEWIKNFML